MAKENTAPRKIKIYSETDRPDPKDHPDLVIDCQAAGDGMTKQHHIAECDINNIMKRFEKTGELPGMIKENPMYGDFSDVKTFQESLDIVNLAQEQFAALSAKVRARFDNDPAKFLEYATDPKNAEDMVSLGLSKKREPSEAESLKAMNKLLDERLPKNIPPAKGESDKA